MLEQDRRDWLNPVDPGGRTAMQIEATLVRIRALAPDRPKRLELPAWFDSRSVPSTGEVERDAQ
jgi:hypothetical protein